MIQLETLTNLGYSHDDAKHLIASAPPCPDWFKVDSRTPGPERLQMLITPPGVDKKHWLGLVQMGNAAVLLRTGLEGITDLEVRAVAGMHLKALHPYWEKAIDFLESKNNWIQENRLDREGFWPVLWALRVMEMTEIAFRPDLEEGATRTELTAEQTSRDGPLTVDMRNKVIPDDECRADPDDAVPISGLPDRQKVAESLELPSHL